jgi:hypothetical protein
VISTTQVVVWVFFFLQSLGTTPPIKTANKRPHRQQKKKQKKVAQVKSISCSSAPLALHCPKSQPPPCTPLRKKKKEANIGN